jgi:hypothetical protein
MWNPLSLKGLALSFVICSPLVAEEGGAGHYIPGGMGTLIDASPTKPGWVAEAIYMHYSGEASISRPFPIAGLLATDIEATSDAAMVGGFYTFEKTLFGAHYSVGGFLPVVSMEVAASLDTPVGKVSRTDSVTDIGDINVVPAMLAWKSGSWQFDALLTIYAPTGDFETGRLANTGLNYWTFEPTVGINYNNEKMGFNFALHTGITLNTKNRDTRYKSGSVLHTEASITQLLPLGKGYLGIGANAFLYKQVSGDSGAGARLGSFKSSSFGIGPALSYFLPIGDKTLAAEVKWIPERNTAKRMEGDSIWLKAVYQF